MSDEKFELTLAGRTFEIRKLNFKQLKAFTPPFIKFGGRLSTPEAFDELANAILACTMRDNPEFTRAVLDEAEVDCQELIKAADVLAVFSGLFKPKGDSEGEAAAATA